MSQILKNGESIMEVVLNNQSFVFKQKKVPGITSKYFTDEHRKYFLKYPIMFWEYDILKREVEILKILDKYKYFPKLIYYTDNFIITNYVGEQLNKNKINPNVINQITEILKILKENNITHGDIKFEEILIDDEDHIYLVDFGWAQLNGSRSLGKNLCTRDPPGLNPEKMTDVGFMNKIFNFKFEIGNICADPVCTSFTCSGETSDVHYE